MDLGLKVMNFVFKMMRFALKMMCLPGCQRRHPSPRQRTSRAWCTWQMQRKPRGKIEEKSTKNRRKIEQIKQKSIKSSKSGANGAKSSPSGTTPVDQIEWQQFEWKWRKEKFEHRSRDDPDEQRVLVDNLDCSRVVLKRVEVSPHKGLPELVRHRLRQEEQPVTIHIVSTKSNIFSTESHIYNTKLNILTTKSNIFTRNQHLLLSNSMILQEPKAHEVCPKRERPEDHLLNRIVCWALEIQIPKR